MRYLRNLPLCLVLGCGEAPPQPQAPEAAAIAAIPVPTVTTVAPSTTVTTKPKLVTVPTDFGSEAVNRVLAPSIPPAPLPAITQPRPRQSDLDNGEIPEKPATFILPNSGMPQAKPVRISPPKEKAPSDLGSRPTLKIQSPLPPLLKAPTPFNPGAADVGPLVRPVPDRASTDDATAEILAAGLMVPKFPVPEEPLPFVRFTIPNPFEYGEQLKGKTGRAMEFATMPSVVNPERR